jgi:hypothetical protein
VTVAQGGSITVSLTGRGVGELPALINAVRVTHRPDL